MKPVTWFPPMWALLCGAVASGVISFDLSDLGRMILGMIFAGPLMCGLSQVINDYFDREIDAINEPHRLIPSGMVSLQQVMVTIVLLALIAFTIATFLGRGVILLAAMGLVTAIAYSAPPIRAKRNGWFGNALVAFSYEGLAWSAGHLAFAPLTPASLIVVSLYVVGTHGIMSINDYKSIEGDRKSNIRTIPVQYGPARTAWMIVIIMNLSQLGVIFAFVIWQNWLIVLALLIILFLQVPIQRLFLKDPMGNYLKFSAIGVSFFVWSMIVAAMGVRVV